MPYLSLGLYMNAVINMTPKSHFITTTYLFPVTYNHYRYVNTYSNSAYEKYIIINSDIQQRIKTNIDRKYFTLVEHEHPLIFHVFSPDNIIAKSGLITIC